jgi:hypothetical protein
MQVEAGFAIVRIGINAIDALRVKRRSAAFHAMDFIAFAEQVSCQIGAILSRYASNKSFFLSHENLHKLQNSADFFSSYRVRAGLSIAGLRPPLRLSNGVAPPAQCRYKGKQIDKFVDDTHP